jgi:S-formylglutathione hydrolase FrmB
VVPDFVSVGRDDGLVDSLVAALPHRAALQLSIREAADYFHATFADGTVSVEPGLPVLLRTCPPESDREDVAHVWGCLALTRAPVINRPLPTGFFRPAADASTLATDGLPRNEAASNNDVFTSDIRRIAVPSEKTVILDMGTGDSSVWPVMPVGAGPYKSRSTVSQKYVSVPWTAS